VPQARQEPVPPRAPPGAATRVAMPSGRAGRPCAAGVGNEDAWRSGRSGRRPTQRSQVRAPGGAYAGRHRLRREGLLLGTQLCQTPRRPVPRRSGRPLPVPGGGGGRPSRNLGAGRGAFDGSVTAVMQPPDVCRVGACAPRPFGAPASDGGANWTRGADRPAPALSCIYMHVRPGGRLHGVPSRPHSLRIVRLHVRRGPHSPRRAPFSPRRSRPLRRVGRARARALGVTGSLAMAPLAQRPRCRLRLTALWGIVPQPPSLTKQNPPAQRPRWVASLPARGRVQVAGCMRGPPPARARRRARSAANPPHPRLLVHETTSF